MLVHLCDLYMAPSVIPFINQVLQLVKFFYAQSYSKQKLSRKSAYVRSLEEEGRSWLPDQLNPYKEKEKCGTLWGFFVPVMLGGRLTVGCAREVEISKTKSPKMLLPADGLKS